MSLLFFACSVCAGDPASSATKGLLFGVLFLLAVIVGLLGVIGATAVSWTRRARRLENGGNPC